MSEPGTGKLSKEHEALHKRVGNSELRKIRARSGPTKSIWEGFAIFGIIGWSVAIPTLVGVAVGIWLDSSYPSPHSWTLTMIVIGAVAGCINAWHWVSGENRNINRNK